MLHLGVILGMACNSWRLFLQGLADEIFVNSSFTAGVFAEAFPLLPGHLGEGLWRYSNLGPTINQQIYINDVRRGNIIFGTDLTLPEAIFLSWYGTAW